jgi:hypothetical protein
MDTLSITSYDSEFGGQNQIVNQQEQNREVNPGGLTQTDSEESLNGPQPEEPEMAEKTSAKEKEKEATPSEEKEEIEAPARKLAPAL